MRTYREVSSTAQLIKSWRNNHMLNLELIRKGEHPTVYLLSKDEVSLVKDSIDVISSPEAWSSAMLTLKDIYDRNIQGYCNSIFSIPTPKHFLPWVGVSYKNKCRNLNELLTEFLSGYLLSLKEDAGRDKDIYLASTGDYIETLTPMKSDTVEVHEDERNGFGDWVCSLFGRTVKTVSKGSKG